MGLDEKITINASSIVLVESLTDDEILELCEKYDTLCKQHIELEEKNECLCDLYYDLESLETDILEDIGGQDGTKLEVEKLTSSETDVLVERNNDTAETVIKLVKEFKKFLPDE